MTNFFNNPSESAIDFTGSSPQESALPLAMTVSSFLLCFHRLNIGNTG